MPAAAPAHPALQDTLRALERRRTPRDLASLDRFGITATNPLGVSMVNIQAIAKSVGRDHGLAAALWDTNIYEARLRAAYVDEPALVTSSQMDRWCRGALGRQGCRPGVDRSGGRESTGRSAGQGRALTTAAGRAQYASRTYRYG
jgi:hypothetical protein